LLSSDVPQPPAGASDADALSEEETSELGVSVAEVPAEYSGLPAVFQLTHHTISWFPPASLPCTPDHEVKRAEWGRAFYLPSSGEPPAR